MTDSSVPQGDALQKPSVSNSLLDGIKARQAARAAEDAARLAQSTQAPTVAPVTNAPPFDGDRLTVLRSVENVHQAKRWTRPDIKPAAAGHGTRWRREEHPVNGIRALSALLTKLETDPLAIVIRGKHTDGEPVTDRRKTVFADQPLHTMLVDIDNYVPDGIDPIANPVAAINQFIAAKLPPAFAGVAYHWQLSSSAGHPMSSGGLKAHVWFWLETARTSAVLQAWADNWLVSHPDSVDRSLFDEIQKHYTALPVMAGMIDPVPARSGFVEGLVGDAVVLELSEQELQASRPARVEGVAGAHQNDPRAQFLVNEGRALGVGRDGRIHIECPNSAQHTSESDTSSTYLPAGTGGVDRGNFKCQHAHCGHLTVADLDAFVGYVEPHNVTPITDPVTPQQAAEQEVIRARNEAKWAQGKVAAVASEGRFKLRRRSELRGRPVTWLIKGILPRAEYGMLFGDSGSGKTFVVLDMALCIARGVPWRDRRVKQGKVVYICAEGSGGLDDRLTAYELHHGIDIDTVPFFAVTDSPDFCQDLDPDKLAVEIDQADLIIIDTLAQVAASANENSGDEMGPVLARCKALAQRTGAMVLVVHHTGKDASKGSRGWSGLRGNAEVQLEVAKLSDTTAALSVVKQKDGRTCGDLGIKLVEVPLRLDEDGEQVASLVVEHTAVAPSQRRLNRTVKGTYPQAVFAALEELCRSEPGGAFFNDLTEAAVNQVPRGDGKHDRRRECVMRAIDSLVKSCKLQQVGDRVRFTDGDL